MNHLPEGTIRRILDEPEVASDKDRDHLESCAVCRIVSSQVHSDVDRVQLLLGAGREDVDPQEALARLLDAITRAEPINESVEWPDPAEWLDPADLDPEPEVPAPRNSGKRERQRARVPFLSFVGRSFVGLGALILLFVAYQLVGTNVVTNKQQGVLAAELKTEWASQVVEDVPNLGEGVALIKIPKVGIDRVVVEGVGVDDLKKGPGHYPGTPLPGQLGNMVISGHRTTYGGPFNRLDELVVGDEILVYNSTGPFKYRVTENKIVSPTAVEVLDNSSDARLTLTTCNPKFSARERLIIVAVLEGPATGASNAPAAQPEFDVVPGES